MTRECSSDMHWICSPRDLHEFVLTVTIFLLKLCALCPMIRQKPLHTLLPACNTHFLFVSGSDDKKFCCIAQSLADQVTAERGILVEDDEASMGKYCAEVFIVPSCSHAVHLEQPLSVALAIWNFLSK